MKKLIFLLLLLIPLAGFSQGLFKPIAPFPFSTENIKLTTPVIKYKWQWRIDGTIQLSEVVYNKVLKELQTNPVFGIGPAIGIDHFVPKSDLDPTAFNNYGFSAAVLLGDKMKFALQANIMQYFKFGITITPNPAKDISRFGLFLGGGITF
jgi:hypothetical protein